MIITRRPGFLGVDLLQHHGRHPLNKFSVGDKLPVQRVKVGQLRKVVVDISLQEEELRS